MSNEKMYPCFLCYSKVGGSCIKQDPTKQNCELVNMTNACHNSKCSYFHPNGFHLDDNGNPIVVCSYGKSKCWVGKNPNCTDPNCRAGRADWTEKKCKICRCNKVHIDQTIDLIDLLYEFSIKHDLIKNKKNDDFDFM